MTGALVAMRTAFSKPPVDIPIFRGSYHYILTNVTIVFRVSFEAGSHITHLPWDNALLQIDLGIGKTLPYLEKLQIPLLAYAHELILLSVR